METFSISIRYIQVYPAWKTIRYGWPIALPATETRMKRINKGGGEEIIDIKKTKRNETELIMVATIRLNPIKPGPTHWWRWPNWRLHLALSSAGLTLSRQRRRRRRIRRAVATVAAAATAVAAAAAAAAQLVSRQRVWNDESFVVRVVWWPALVIGFNAPTGCLKLLSQEKHASQIGHHLRHSSLLFVFVLFLIWRCRFGHGADRRGAQRRRRRSPSSWTGVRFELANRWIRRSGSMLPG